MNMRASLALLMIVGCAGWPARGSDQTPGKAQDRPVALVNATVHPVSKPSLERGMVLFEGGRITHVGARRDLPGNAQVIDLAGKHVYPSLFEAYSDIGLIEVNAVRASRDRNEVGEINPNVMAHVSVNPDSELIPVARANGVLLALSAPASGIISGQSAVMQLDGWTYEEMTLKGPVAMHLHWPYMTPTASWTNKDSFAKQIQVRDRALKKIRDTFADARAYRKARNADPEGTRIDARWQAMIPVLEGKVPVVFHADSERRIRAAVAFAQREGLRAIIHGGYDAERCAELLVEHDVPVIVSAVHRLPRRRDEGYDTPFTLPDRLRQAGVTYCIGGARRFGASMLRNLPYHAGTAVAYGLPRDEAIKAITLYPAQILGVADRVGSLEAGKDATLIVTTGDPLETETQVTRAYIQGRAVDLSSRHTQLWRKYQEKYRRQQPDN